MASPLRKTLNLNSRRHALPRRQQRKDVWSRIHQRFDVRNVPAVDPIEDFM
jgi:hypothetical protein